jgi:hypothetical protein
MYALLIANYFDSKSKCSMYVATTDTHFYIGYKFPISVNQYKPYPGEDSLRLKDRLQIWNNTGYKVVLKTNEPITKFYIEQNHPELLL